MVIDLSAFLIEPSGLQGMPNEAFLGGVPAAGPSASPDIEED
jgi:hypothetical protein